jgi:hypothetical protein
VLDMAKGHRAMHGYHDFSVRFCESLADAGAGTRRLLESVGLHPTRDLPSLLCPPGEGGGRPIASGSFLEPGADEVLLATMYGQGEAEGSTTLAVMRAEGDHYRLVRHLFLNLMGEGFAAKLRIVTPSGRDVLLVCTERGNMGVYTGHCGFFGQGSFRGNGTDADLQFASVSEFDVLLVLNCGPAATIAIGDVAFHDDRIALPLDVVESVLKPGGPGTPDAEVLPDWPCQKQTHRKETHVTLEYEVAPSAPEAHGQGRVRPIAYLTQHVVDVFGRFF